jgi:hypothetical protein
MLTAVKFNAFWPTLAKGSVSTLLRAKLGKRGLAILILNFWNHIKNSQLHHTAALLSGNGTRYPLDRRSSGPYSLSSEDKINKNSKIYVEPDLFATVRVRWI